MASGFDYRGVMAVLVTPMNRDESVDEAGFRRLLQHVMAGGVHAVVVLGSAGEFASLVDREKERAIEIAVDEVAGRLPVIAGTGEPATKRAVQMTVRARELGANAAMVVPPYYARVSDQEVIEHYRIVAREGGLPVILYNIPGCTKITLSPDVAATLAKEPGIVGIKDSSGDLMSMRRFAQATEGLPFSRVTGSDGLFFYTLLAGGTGCISPGANVAPSWFVAVWDAVKEGRLADALAMQQRIDAMYRAIAHAGFPAFIKGALTAMDICQPWRSAPSPAAGETQLAAIRAGLVQVGIL